MSAKKSQINEINEEIQQLKEGVRSLKEAVFAPKNTGSWLEQQVAELRGQVSILKKVLYILLTAVIGGVAIKLIELSLK